ncbi:MAG TPA: tetratricopeptide repeat protein [Arachnia sp.]|nr:tetratricopeptide repeat protein [Arachnia sp.]
MSTAARIEELLGKFDENPRRYFAPLANEYRKAGDLAQAIAICREHLPKQPGHMSGHIVFGQALYESGELDEAQEIFEAALALDPENLIALRHLGDIARQRGDTIGARRWYGRVLDADPRNDDIAALIAALPSRVTPMASSAIAEPTVVSTTPPTADETAGSFADEPAWHTPSFLQSTPSAPTSAPVDAAPPPSAPPVELLDLDGPLDDVAPSPVEATLPIDGFAATHDETAHDEIGDTLAVDPLAVDALASVVEPVSGAHAIDEALGAFASHDPLDLDVVAVTEETIDIVEASATPSEPVASTLDGIAFDATDATDATDAIEAAPLDLAPAFDTVAVEAELVEAAPFVEAGSDAEVDAAEGLEAAYAEIGGPGDVALESEQEGRARGGRRQRR